METVICPHCELIVSKTIVENNGCHCPSCNRLIKLNDQEKENDK